MDQNSFDEVLGLEEQFYEDGYQQGLADGVKAGKIEGRKFGLETGFEKYVQSGILYGKSLVWANRISQVVQDSDAAETVPDTAETSSASPLPSKPESVASSAVNISRLADNPRLAKHIRVLHALVEPDSLSTENSEDAVSDFDDRLKRAQAKAKIIERMAGEEKGEETSGGKSTDNRNGAIEDVAPLPKGQERF